VHASRPNSTVVTARPPLPSRLRSVAGRLPHPERTPLALAYAIGPLCVIPLWVLGDLRLIEHYPVWVYAALIFGPTVPSTVSNVLYKRHPSTLTLNLRSATDSLATTVIVYATGWGPELGLVYLVAAQQLVGSSGPGTWRISRRWSLVGVACGQVGIALRIVPSFVRSPVDNGAAILGLAAFFLVSRMATAITTDRERALMEVQASEERFRSLVHSSSDMILVLDEESRPLYVSDACERILGVSADELRRADLASLMDPAEVDAIRQCLGAAILRREPTEPIELRARHADGQWRHLEMIGTNLRENPAVGGVVLNVRDVTDRHKMEAELSHRATHDSLTGLPNRRLFLELLGASLYHSRRSSERPAVLFLDVDRFKLINDTLGHEVGDQMLVEVSRRLRSAVADDHTVARFGGDEFVVLCEPGEEPVALAGVLLSTFDEPFVLGGQTYFLNASIGLAASHSPDTLPADLIRDADTAMYRAKERGRGRLEIFDEAARSAALARVHTEHLLRGAEQREELRLYYQPLMDLKTGRVVAAEALVRWQHPEFGLVAPDRFIEVAEDTGLIVPVGAWVLRTACLQAEEWARRGRSIDLAVNVSARQLSDDCFLDTVREALAPLSDLGGPAPAITLEITERVLIREPEAVGPRLDELKTLGIQLSMDDFGTGYSSLSNLRRYPFDSLKIDRRFVAGLTDREDDGTIVRAIIALAHGLGKTVVAEGVETADQLAALRELGCDLAQGFHVGRPQPATTDPGHLLLPVHRQSFRSRPVGGPSWDALSSVG
jgi:diguanylate cyclase (GGDEF)-like protein/PAS domain S-box-containing protein